MENIKVSKNLVKYAVFISILAIALFSTIFFYQASNKQDSEFTTGSAEKFAVLKGAGTSLCSGPGFIDAKENTDRLQGSCCSKMDFHRYEEQVEGLKKFKNINKIPPDPYDISVSLARELLDYQKSIVLTQEQQAIYDNAVKLSHEGGPCCCKCWRWYAFEGLAKYLITEYDFNAEQIAEIWDLEDGCGGTGHTTH